MTLIRTSGVRVSGDAVSKEFPNDSDARVRNAFGVSYVLAEDADGNHLWVTRHGWPYLACLDPQAWFSGQQYAKRGTRLTDGTGTVYRVPTPGLGDGGRIDLVVKFSRMAQEVRLHVASEFQDSIPLHAADAAEFPSPFREFGLVEELRRCAAARGPLRMLIKRPLAIFSPANRFQPQQLGRTADRFARQQRQLDRDQATQQEGLSCLEERERFGGEAIGLAIDRQYVSIFQWVRGVDAEQLVRDGTLAPRDAAALVEQAVRELGECGFRMLDIKPSHIIVRRKPDGSFLQRGDRLVYALVDFELLQRIEHA
jgi:hypothetical protein